MVILWHGGGDIGRLFWDWYPLVSTSVDSGEMRKEVKTGYDKVVCCPGSLAVGGMEA